MEPLEQRQLLSVSTPGEAEYLIIAADNYLEEVATLAEWKHMKGVPTYVASMTEVGATDADILNYITDAYNIGPETSYVLLVGDHEDVPGHEIIGHTSHGVDHVWHTDYPYACVDGGDLLPDLAIGRLPGDTDAQITTMVQKVMRYDRTPDMGDWYDDALVAGYFQDYEEDDDGNVVDPLDGTAARMFMETTHRSADFLGGDYDFWSDPDPLNAGYTVHTALNPEDDSFYPNYHYQGWSYPGRDTPPDPVPTAWSNLWTGAAQATADISTAVNNGVSLLFHRDHGGLTGWGDPPFHNAEVDALTNGDMLPVVFSINCQTGRYDHPDDDCFAEAWMRNDNGGAVGVVAPPRNSQSGYNDCLVLGLFDGFWDDADDTWTSTDYPTSWRPSEVLNRAKVRVLDGYSSNTSSIQAAQMFNWFGDPEMMLRTQTPDPLQVAHQTTVQCGQGIDLTVTVQRGGAPFEDALVCISKGDSTDYWVGTTNASGQVAFAGLTTSEFGQYDIVASAHDTFPYVGTIASEGDLIIDANDPGGNGMDNGADDHFRLVRNGDEIEVYIDGNFSQSVPAAFIDRVLVNGSGDDDTLEVDFSGGSPIPVGGIVYTGAGEDSGDTLEVVGNGGQHGYNRPDGNDPGAGEISVGDETITYTGLEPVTISGFEEFTFVTPNSNDSLTIDSPAAGRNRISGTSGDVAFEALTFFGINHFKIDTATNDDPLGDRNDLVEWSSDLVASGLDSFTVETGAGNDIVDASAVTSLGVTLLGGIGDDVLVGGDGSDRLEGGDGMDTLFGGDGDDMLFGGSGPDRLEGGLGHDIIDGGDGPDTYIFYGQGAGFDDRITVESYGTSVMVSNTVPVAETDILNDIEQLDINTGDSLGTSPISDQVTIDSLLGTEIEVINFDGGPEGMSNRLILNGTDAAETITVSNLHSGGPAFGQVLGLRPVITLRNFDGAWDNTLEINSLGGDDVIDGAVRDLLFPPLYVFNGGDGDDLLIGGPADDILDGGAGDDTFVGNGGTDSITGGDGGDTILVEGTPADDTITIDMVGGELQVSVNGALTTYTETGGDMPAVERLLIEAGDGDDAINAVPLPGIFTVVNAGPPAASDTLNVTVPGDATITQGAVSTSGTISAWTVSEIDYTGLELLNINTDAAGSALVVRATDDNDTLAVQPTPDVETRGAAVWVNDGPMIQFNTFFAEPGGFILLGLEGRFGDDSFSITPLNGVNIVAHGGDPTASDTAVVNGTVGSDTIIYTPLATDAGLIEVNALGHVTVETMESLVINGLGGDDALTVRGTAGDDTFVHTPGAMVDAGSVMVNLFLPVAYEGLGAGGSVTIDDSTGGGLDILISEGTDLDDTFEVSAGTGTVDLQTNPLLGARQHVPVHQSEIEYLTLSGFDGDDLMVVNAPQPYGSILLQGGGPGNSDMVQIMGEDGVVDAVEVIPNGPDGSGIVMVNGVSMSYSGVEDLHLLGHPLDADSLVINGTLAENQWEVERGSLLHGTRVQIDSREMIEYGEFSEIELRNAVIPIGGADVFRVHPAYIGNLTVTGTGEDVLQIIGTGGGDAATLTTTTATLASTAVTYSGMVQLDVLTGSGDDMLEVTVDAAFGSDLIGVPITFDGGEGSDGLTVSGTPSAGTAEATYSPGPAEGQGRLAHTDGVTTMTVDFLNLEPIVDLVPGPLLVLGTPAANTINYEQGLISSLGRVTVDNFELIEFSFKTSLTIDALAGNDVINLDNAARPTGLGSITVRGRDGDDTITLANLPASVPATVNAGSGDDLVDGSGVAAAALNLNGDAGSDTLIGGGANDALSGGTGDDMLIADSGNNAYNGGAGYDTIGILGTLGNDRVDVHQTSPSALLSVVNGDTRNDTVTQVEAVRIELDRGDDIIRVMHDDSLVATPAGSLRIEVVGDAPNASDRLAVVDDGDGDVVIYRKAPDQRSGSITVGPLAPVVFEGIEYLDITPLNQITGGTGADGHGRLVVFKPDPFENNNSLPTATYLGSGATVNVDPTIDPGGDPEFGLPGDADWYRFVAAETGTLDFQVYFEEIGMLANERAGLPGDGNLDIEVYDVDGTLIAGNGPDFGTNDADSDERIRIPAVAGQTYYLRVFGHSDDAVNVYNMTVLNELPPVPYDIELDDIPVGDPPPQNSDTGRSQFDNITRNNTPLIVFRLDDARLLHDLPGNPTDDTPPDEVIPIPFNSDQTATTTTAGYRVAVFDEGDPQQPGQLPQVPVGYARQIAEGVYEFSFDTDTLNPGFALTDGSHFISAKVQMIDPADPTQTGFGARGASLEIVVDTVAPPVFFGENGVVNDGLHPDSDTGIEDQTDTFVDRITSDTTPSFWGVAEADTIVRVYADMDGDAVLDPSVDLYLGETVAVPLDGTNQFPRGQWNFTTNIDMNDPAYFASIDGLRTIFTTAEDVAGNVSEPEVLDIFIDTRGPQVEEVNITDNEDYDLFDPKPSEDGPTPLVFSLDIDFIDRPERIGETLIVGDDAVFVIDVSGSTTGLFGGTPVGDLNGDGTPDTILDAEIAGFIALNQELIDRGLGDTSNVSIVPFGSSAWQIDMDPVTAGVQLATTPNADQDSNGVPDVEDALRGLTSGGGTNFEAALQTTIDTVTAVGTAPANGNVIFLSDGHSGGTYDDEVATLGAMGLNLRAFGVGTSSSLPALLIIDPSAVQFTTTDELLDVFGGGGGSSGSSSVFIYPAVNEILATTPGNFQLVGDANGIIPIESIDFLDHTVSGDIGRTTIRLNFFEPLPDDRFTLTVSDRIKDDPGNALDGESNAAEPQEVPQFPSGDGDPGEDFVARFTVDSRPEIGVWGAGSVWVDTNGNFIFDPKNLDFTNRDITYVLGYTSDDIFAGNFTDGVCDTADGFDKLAAYGRVGSQYRWLVDTDNDGVANVNHDDPANINGLPVAGNFDGDSVNGDEVGLFTGTTWWLDTDHDFEVDTSITSAIVGYPIVGDFDGDGLDDLAAWADDEFQFDLAHNGFGQKDAVIDEGFAVVAGFIGVRERPVAADMDQDGIDDIGLWVPDRCGATPEESAEWYFLISDDRDGTDRVSGTVNTLDHSFEPVPFGKDLYAKFGDEYAEPIVGNFDPPATTSSGSNPAINTPRVSITLVDTPTTTDVVGEVNALADNMEWIDEWDSFWVEIWVDTPDSNTGGVVGASVDLSYNTDYFTAVSVEYGPAFTESQTAGIDDPAGLVNNISASTTLGNVGDDGAALLARVLFKPTADDVGVALDAGGQFTAPVEDLGLGLSDARVELSGVGLAPDVELGDTPDTKLWPVIYDLDDDGQVGFGDLAYFAGAFQQSTADPNAVFAWASDFDRSGYVDFGDLSYLSANFQSSRANGSAIQYPANFPSAWWLGNLVVDCSVPASGPAEQVTEAQLSPIAAEAISRLASGAGGQTQAMLEEVTIKIVDLPDGRLAQASSDTIWIDQDAAGYGWFVDATPRDDVEFLHRTGTDELMATLGSPAVGRVDLLTTMMHELGHVLGFEHSESRDLMYPTLSLGTRRLLNEQLFAAYEHEQDAGDFWDRDDSDPEAVDQLFGLLGKSE